MFSLKVCWPLLSFMLAVNQAWVVGELRDGFKARRASFKQCKSQCWGGKMQEFGDKAGWPRGCEFGRDPRRHWKNAKSIQLCAMQWALLSSPTTTKVFPGCQMKYTAAVFTSYLLQAEIFFLIREIKEAKTLHKALYYLTKPGRCSLGQVTDQ